ncbi:hypothetical protein K432DRAFT_261378, partial [Lepidopterella palustris CBS 459.81]
TANAEWPEQELPKNLPSFINAFFEILDYNTDDAGERLANDIFAPDGVFATPKKVYTGKTEIAGCCTERWAGVKDRIHVIDKVYTCKKDGSDLLMIG